MRKSFAAKQVVPALIVLLALCGSVHLGAALKVAVKVRSANIRVEPSLDSAVMSVIKQGTILDVLEKLENWYLVELPPDPQGSVSTGYIHASVVTEMADADAPQSPPAENPLKTKPAVEKAVTPGAKEPPPSVTRAAEKEVRSTSSRGPARKKIFIRLAGGYASKKYSYDSNWSFSLYQENGSVTEAYDMDMSGSAFEGAIGFMFTPNVGLELSYAPSTGKTKGVFSAAFPHPFYYDVFREKSWEKTGMSYSASELSMNILLAFPVFSKLNFYLTAGGTYFLNVKIENLKSLSWTESSYPYADVSISPQYADFSKSTFGFNGGGGLDFFFTPGIALNLQARYSSGEAKIKVEETEISIKPGGVRATAGIKFAF